MSSIARKAVSESAVRWQSVAWQVAVGFVFGYVVLHPVAMVIFHWLDPRVEYAMSEGMASNFFGPVVHSFHLSMQPMGFVFGVIGAAITTFYGYHRLVLTIQRDRLAEELRRNEQFRSDLAEQAKRLKRSNTELARLERANRRTSQFMAHDFKTGLGCVGGFASQLLELPRLRNDPEAGSALAAIRRQAHRMMGNVTDLLEFSRVRERGAPQMQRTSVADLLRGAVSDFSLPAHTRHISIGSGYSRCPPVAADPRLLRRVLCNLISNAIHHNGPETNVQVDAHLKASRTEVVFSCCDDGAGIPPELLPSIFREFTTTGDAKSQSTGLGLAFCMTVVQAHGGRIWCKSSPGQGAQFYFTIPLHKAPDTRKPYGRERNISSVPQIG